MCTSVETPSSEMCTQGAGETSETDNNPMHPVWRLRRAPRCLARSRRSGQPCKSPAMRGKKRCRLHGGGSTGAPKGRANGNYRHGLRTRELVEMKRAVRVFLATAREGLGGD
jgi:hypothetical protein